MFMTDPLSPSEARADDLQQRAEDAEEQLRANGQIDHPCFTRYADTIRDLLAALVQAEQREADYKTKFYDSDALVQQIQAVCSPDEDNDPVGFVIALRQEIEGLKQERDGLLDALGYDHGELLKAEARLSTYEATIRQVEQELRAVPADDDWHERLTRWADTLLALLPDERKG
jgi:hypothetical protein